MNYKELIGFTCSEFFIAIGLVSLLSIVAYPAHEAALEKQKIGSAAQSALHQK